MKNIGNGASLKKKNSHAQDTEKALTAGIYAWIDDNKNLVQIAQRLAGLAIDLGLCDTNAHNPFQIVPTDLFAENGNLHHELFLNIDHAAWGYFRVQIESEFKFSVVEPKLINCSDEPLIFISELEVEQYIKSLAATLDDHYKLLDLLDDNKLEDAQTILDTALNIYKESIKEPFSRIKNIIDTFDGEIAIKATNDEAAIQSIKSMENRYDLALLHPENWVVVKSNGIEGQDWLSSWLKSFFVDESKAASLLYLYQKLIKDAGYRVIVHTDSEAPETDLTGEVLRDENMNLTLVRPVIHAIKLEILNG
jgi:hypothetical protein